MTEPVVGTSSVHDHSWQLVSIESECGVEVRELLCTTCSAVMIDG